MLPKQNKIISSNTGDAIILSTPFMTYTDKTAISSEDLDFSREES